MRPKVHATAHLERPWLRHVTLDRHEVQPHLREWAPQLRLAFERLVDHTPIAPTDERRDPGVFQLGVLDRWMEDFRAW